jgi:hypothetical protein
VGWERGSSQLSAAGTQKASDTALQALRDLVAESERAQAVAESAATQAAQDVTNAICDKREAQAQVEAMQHELKQAQSKSKQLLREADALKRKLKEDVGAGEELEKNRISFSKNSELKKDRDTKDRDTAFDQTLRDARQTVFDETREACRRDMARLLRELELKLGQALESVKYAKQTSAHTIRLSEKSSYLHQSLSRTISSTAGSDFYTEGGGGGGGGGGDNVFSAALHREAMINTKQCKESAERLNCELSSIHQQLSDVLTSVSSHVSGTPRRNPRANTCINIPRTQDTERGSGTLEVPRSEKYSQW